MNETKPKELCLNEWILLDKKPILKLEKDGDKKMTSSAVIHELCRSSTDVGFTIS